MIFYLYYDTHVLEGSGQVFGTVVGDQFVNYRVSLMRVTKYFIFHLFFIFSCLIALVVLVIVLTGIFLVYTKSISIRTRSRDWEDFLLNDEEAKDWRTKTRGKKNFNKYGGEEEVTKEGCLGIFLPLESKESPQASLTLMLIQTILSSSRLSFSWCNNPSLEELLWKSLIYPSRPF